ncbi:MAG TPA: hypothetical protein VFG63_15800 [Nocardioidaceae bacterium]|nr:hypothetical protein [Nocardioidaceae bacterium]
MITPLPIAKVLFAVALTMFAMAVLSGELVVKSLFAVFLAGQLVGKAVKG